jgi:hypothetical protein
VQQSKLTEHIDRTLASGIEVLAVIRLWKLISSKTILDDFRLWWYVLPWTKNFKNVGYVKTRNCPLILDLIGGYAERVFPKSMVGDSVAIPHVTERLRPTKNNGNLIIIISESNMI